MLEALLAPDFQSPATNINSGGGSPVANYSYCKE